MLNWILEPLTYTFMLRALLASVLVGVTCAVVGCYVVLRSMAFLGDAMAHAILPGVAIAGRGGGWGKAIPEFLDYLKTVPDLETTIDATARKAYLDIHMRPERHNTVKVLMFMDIGGTMDDHIKLAEELFSASKTEFKHLEYFYFHNFVYERVWRDNRRRATERMATWDVLHKYPHDYKVVIVGDATNVRWTVMPTTCGKGRDGAGPCSRFSSQSAMRQSGGVAAAIAVRASVGVSTCLPKLVTFARCSSSKTTHSCAKSPNARSANATSMCNSWADGRCCRAAPT